MTLSMLSLEIKFKIEKNSIFALSFGFFVLFLQKGAK